MLPCLQRALKSEAWHRLSDWLCGERVVTHFPTVLACRDEELQTLPELVDLFFTATGRLAQVAVSHIVNDAVHGPYLIYHVDVLGSNPLKHRTKDTARLRLTSKSDFAHGTIPAVTALLQGPSPETYETHPWE